VKNKKWILSATILGLVFFIVVWVVKPIGVSTQFSVTSGIIHSIIDPSVITEDSESKTGYSSTNEYYNKSDGKLAKAIKNPLNYGFVFVLAIIVGAFLARALFEKKNEEDTTNLYSSCDSSKGKKTVWQIYLPPFFGGIFLLYGARLAGGCTSGHMMSGMMQGSVSGYLFAVAVFLVAIPIAILIHKKNI